MKNIYKIGQKVTFKKGPHVDFAATWGIIKRIDHDPSGEYGSYLIENNNPLIIGWFNESQFEPYEGKE